MTASMAAVNEQCVRRAGLRIGSERNDRAAAERLIATLALLNERALSRAFATARRRQDLEVQEQLLVIWQRALGLPAE